MYKCIHCDHKFSDDDNLEDEVPRHNKYVHGRWTMSGIPWDKNVEEVDE